MREVRPDSAETQDLLRQIGAGDRQAFGQLFARHHAYLQRLVELRLDPRLRSRVDPADVVQEAYLEALNRLNEYLKRPALPFRLWLRQIGCERGVHYYAMQFIQGRTLAAVIHELQQLAGLERASQGGSRRPVPEFVGEPACGHEAPDSSPAADLPPADSSLAAPAVKPSARRCSADPNPISPSR